MLGLGNSVGASQYHQSSFTNLRSLSFNGSTEYGNVTSIPSIDIDVGTLSVWVKLDTGGTNMQVFKASVDSNNNIQIFHNHASNTINFQYKAGGTSKSFSTSFNHEGDDTWRHLLMTWDTTADELFAYINGVSVDDAKTGLGTWSGTIDNVYVARNTTASNSFYAGHIDELSLFNTVETAATIYNSGAPGDLSSHAGLIGWWRMEEGTGTTIADSSSSSNAMTLYNTPSHTTDVP